MLTPSNICAFKVVDAIVFECLHYTVYSVSLRRGSMSLLLALCEQPSSQSVPRFFLALSLLLFPSLLFYIFPPLFLNALGSHFAFCGMDTCLCSFDLRKKLPTFLILIFHLYNNWLFLSPCKYVAYWMCLFWELRAAEHTHTHTSHKTITEHTEAALSFRCAIVLIDLLTVICMLSFYWHKVIICIALRAEKVDLFCHYGISILSLLPQQSVPSNYILLFVFYPGSQEPSISYLYLLLCTAVLFSLRRNHFWRNAIWQSMRSFSQTTVNVNKLSISDWHIIELITSTQLHM